MSNEYLLKMFATLLMSNMTSVNVFQLCPIIQAPAQL